MPRWNNPNCGFQKGHGQLRPLGYKHSENTKLKISQAQKGKPRPYQAGDKHGEWKGDDVSYSGIHKWVAQYKGSPKHCEMCHRTDKTYYHWANIDHNYYRKLEDYIRLCPKCHKKYDKSLKNRQEAFL